LSSEDVRQAIAAGNVKQPKGGFDGEERSSTLDANDQLISAEDYRRLIVSWRNGAPVRIGDVAEVVHDAENARLAAWSGTKPAIILQIRRQPGANVIEVADRIKAALPALGELLPSGIDLELLADRTTTIRASVHSVQEELLLAVVLVVAVIFVFLRSARATVIPAVAVPLSLVGTFAAMWLCGFSLNNLTLMALTIATGFVVDDAIVVVENIARHLEEGDSPMEAALKGSRQIAFTILSLTLSLVAVLIPLLFMQDVVGRLFREFSITLAISILLSAVISLTLTPMMCARLLRHGGEGRLARAVGRFFDAIIAGYAWLLRLVLRHQVATMLVFAATLLLTAGLYQKVSKGFFPPQDTGLLQGMVIAPQDISFAAMSELQQRIAGEVLEDAAVLRAASFIGVDGVNTLPNTGRLLIALKPRGERDASAAEVARRLVEKVERTPGARFYLQSVQDLTIEDRVSPTQYQLTLQCPDEALLADAVNRLTDEMGKSPLLGAVVHDLQPHGRQARVVIDREKAGRVGITASAVSNALYNAFGQRLVSTIYTQSGQYRVVLEHGEPFQNGLDAIQHVQVPAPGGKPVALNAIARLEEASASLATNRLDQFPMATISFDLAPSVSLGAGVAEVRRMMEEVELPAAIERRFEGAAHAFERALDNQLLLILAAVVVMYLVLGMLYESFIHPVTILSTLPSAAVGALLALEWRGTELGVMGIVGIVLLIGIVKKNAIMMIDFALDAERAQGLPPREAIYQACLLRFRPILMTTLAALFGALPLMLGTGEGSELRQPLGITMVGGLIFSQVLTLFTTPVIYLMFGRMAGSGKEVAA
jgi:multidrug efflux pump